jgi:hypothetical protein
MWILLGSLALNVALALALSRPRDSAPPSHLQPEAASSAKPSAIPSAATAARASTETPPATPRDTIPAAPEFHWSQLESSDYKEYIARLRDFGTPERTIRDIIVADVAKLYRPRLAALRPPRTTQTNFWERYYTPSAEQGTKEQREQLRAVQREQKELLKSLLGENVHEEIANDAGWGADHRKRFCGEMTEDQCRKLRQAHEHHGEVTSEIYTRAGNYHDEETQKELKAARRKLREELAAFLSPEQIEEHELRTSDTANNMRWQLQHFEPTEVEFRAIHKHKQATEELNESRGPGPSTDESRKAREEKRKALDDALAQSLGSDRMKDLQLSEAYEFRNLLEGGVLKDSVQAIADMKQEAEAAARNLRKDTALSKEQRDEALAAIRAETEKSITGLVGERRARYYTRSGGHWIRNLAPSPARPPP